MKKAYQFEIINSTPLPGHLDPAEISVKAKNERDKGDKPYTSAGTFKPVLGPESHQVNRATQNKPNLFQSLKRLIFEFLVS